VHESVGAPVLGLDEAITLVGVEELYGSSDHFDVSFYGRPPIGLPVLGEARRRKWEPQSAEDRPIATSSELLGRNSGHVYQSQGC
jgi:hypothetical protein